MHLESIKPIQEFFPFTKSIKKKFLFRIAYCLDAAPLLRPKEVLPHADEKVMLLYNQNIQSRNNRPLFLRSLCSQTEQFSWKGAAWITQSGCLSTSGLTKHYSVLMGALSKCLKH